MLAFQPYALALILLTLSSCAYAPGGRGFPWEINFSGFVCSEKSTQYLEGVDWKKAKVLDLRIRQGQFSPTYLGIYTDQPYLLNIENADDIDHSFMAFDFFRAIAVAGVSADGADFKEIRCLAGVTIPPKTKTSLRLVAVRDGTYEFDNSSIINSLAMIGSGGGFITVELGRRVVKSSVEQPVLFDYKPVVIQRERIKINKFDSSEDQSLTLNSSNKASSEGLKTKQLEQPSKGKKTTQLEQPSKPFEGAETKQSTDSGARQTNANSAPHEKPASKEVFDELPDNRVPDQAKDTSSDIKGELDKKNTQDKAPIVENTSTTFENDREHSKQEPPWGYQFFKGPPADVYSDPPDNVRNQSDFDGANGDSGEDKLNSSS